MPLRGISTHCAGLSVCRNVARSFMWAPRHNEILHLLPLGHIYLHEWQFQLPHLRKSPASAQEVFLRRRQSLMFVSINVQCVLPQTHGTQAFVVITAEAANGYPFGKHLFQRRRIRARKFLRIAFHLGHVNLSRQQIAFPRRCPGQRHPG